MTQATHTPDPIALSAYADQARGQASIARLAGEYELGLALMLAAKACESAAARIRYVDTAKDVNA